MQNYLIVGTGPAGLLAADILSQAGKKVVLFERRPAAGWKLLVAGSSGLNVSYEAEDLAPHYPFRSEEMKECLAAFGKNDWLSHLQGLGEETYLGTSRRHFVKNFTASTLLKSWIARLQARGAAFHFGHELKSFGQGYVEFTNGARFDGKAVLLALGGPSWETEPSNWPRAFAQAGVEFTPFSPANAGYSFRAPEGFFAIAEGKPIKGLCLTTRRGARQGELMITRYGLEGTPVYSMGCPGPAEMDLKPDLAEAKLKDRLQPFRGDTTQKLRGAKLSPGAELLFKALAPDSAFESPAALAAALKHLSIELLEPRPLTESISARGGVSWDELDASLQLKKVPRVFLAGEMVDWDAPTGGFLIQGSVSMAAKAAAAMLALA